MVPADLAETDASDVDEPHERRPRYAENLGRLGRGELMLAEDPWLRTQIDGLSSTHRGLSADQAKTSRPLNLRFRSSGAGLLGDNA